jgi:hypothetical protein
LPWRHWLIATVLQHLEPLHLHLFWTWPVRHWATRLLAGFGDDDPPPPPPSPPPPLLLLPWDPNTPTASHAAATVPAYPPAKVSVHSRAVRKVDPGVRQAVLAL